MGRRGPGCPRRPSVVDEVDPVTFRWTGHHAAEALAGAGNRECVVVASAPSYPHGVVDDVEGIAAAAAAAGVRCHVDACIGGLVLPFLARAGHPVPRFDLSVPGVTSLSVDLHKYGYAPKGASLLLHSDRDLRTAQYWAWTGWPGYPVVNSAITSSKPLGPLAAAWAVMQVLGDQGLAQAAATLDDMARTIRAHPVPGVRLLGDPVGPLLAFGADPDAAGPVDPFLLVDAIAVRGWVAQAQPASGSLPRSLHMT